MKIDFPTLHEKNCFLIIAKKQSLITYLMMKIGFMHPKIYDCFSNIYFEIRRMKSLKSCYFKRTTKIPNFLIIGFPKAGTTSLHEYLSQHPKIFGSWVKETHFFSYGYKKGINYYFKFFNFNNQPDSIYFESSPEYIYYPEALQRIKKLNPKMKFIVCLRNPIDLSFSSYNQAKNLGIETESFEKVLLQEDYKRELHKKRLENNIYSFNRRPLFLAYLYISEYYTYIKNALDIFDFDNFFFIDSEELKKHPQNTMDKIFEFLGLETHKIEFTIYNKSDYSEKLSLETRQKLANYFEPFNHDLEKLINKKFNWS